MPQDENRPEVESDGDSRCASVSLSSNTNFANNDASTTCKDEPSLNASYQHTKHHVNAVGSVVIVPDGTKSAPQSSIFVKPTKGSLFQANLHRIGISNTATNGNKSALSKLTQSFLFSIYCKIIVS